MIRFLLPLVQIGLLVYCLVDCIQSDSDRVRNLPKVVWVILIVLLPVIGGIAWLVAGRPERTPTSRAPWPATRTSGFPEYERPGGPPRGPDDDPDFLRRLRPPRDQHDDHGDDEDRGDAGEDDGAAGPAGPPDGPPGGAAPR